MKTKLTAILAIVNIASAMFSARAEILPADTLAIVKDAHSVLVTRSANMNTITIMGQGEDDEFYYSYTSQRVDTVAEAPKGDDEWGLSLPFLREVERKKSEVVWLGNTQIGICMPIDAPAGFDPSIDLGIGKVVGIKYTPWNKGPFFSFGVGVFAQKFTLHNKSMFDNVGKSLVVIGLPEGARNSHVRLYNFGFQMPFTITQNLYRGFSLSAGVVMKFNTYTTASNKYSIDNRSYDTSFKGLQQRILTYDIYGGLGWDNFSLYCRYSPLSLFSRGNGPQFEVVSFGVNLGF